MGRYTYTDEELTKAVKNSFSIAGVCRELGIRPVGGNYKTLKSKIKLLKLDTSHFTGRGWNVGLKFRPRKEIPLKDILVEDSSYKSTLGLKKRLLKSNLKEHKCEICGNTEWLGKPIPLELHHINGNNTDNRLENLQLLCPNCHSTTDNYRGRNLQSALSEKRDVEYRKFRETLTGNAEGNPEPSSSLNPSDKACAETLHDKPKSSRKTKLPKITYCAYCGAEMVNSRNKCCSQECAHKLNGSKRPNVMELLDKFKELHSYTQVGKFYGVSDNAVKKWVKLYGIEDMVKRKSKSQTEKE